jgi:D-alanyl-D-alanine carboxypeptidase
MNPFNQLLIAILVILSCSCTREYYKPDSVTDCSVTFVTHPHDEAYQNWLDEISRKGIVGLTVLIDKPGEELWMGSAGYASIEQGIKMTPCHLHHTASIYKTYVSVIVLQLVAEGEVSLEDKISMHVSQSIIKNLPGGDQITVQQLLEHRSGLADPFEVEFMLGFFNDPARKYSAEDLLGFVSKMKPKYAPGENFYYSDANYVLLSLMISEVEGNITDSFNKRIRQPLGLSGTHFLGSESPVPAGLANSYWDRHGDGKIENISDYQLTLTTGLWGADGIITTAYDAFLFIKALTDGKLVPQSLYKKMIACNEVPELAQNNYGIKGYGMGIMHVNVGGSDWFGHSGNHIGSAALLLYCPQKQITLVVFQNIGTFLSDYTKRYIFNDIIKDCEGFSQF